MPREEMGQASDSTLAIVNNDILELQASPGQFFLAVPPSYDPYLPQTIFPFRLNSRAVDSFLLPPEVQTWARHGPLRLRGPYGNGFRLPAKGARALVLAADARSGAIMMPLLQCLVEWDCEITLVCLPTATSEQRMPPQVEIHIADDILSASDGLWTWADAVFAGGGTEFYDLLVATVRERRLRLEAGWGQLILHSLANPCGTGLCYLCALKTRRGFVLNCREGPVYDLADWLVAP